MVDTKSGAVSVQSVPGTHCCARKKGIIKDYLSFQKNIRSQPEGVPVGRGDTEYLKKKKKKKTQMIETH